MKYLINLMFGLEVESDNWTMDAEMLNQAQGLNKLDWWDISAKSGANHPQLSEYIRRVTLAEALRESIAVARKRHQHDCSRCIYLGSWQRNAEHYDLYYCDQSGMPTVIARFGDEGAYYSGMGLANVERSLGEARDRAKILGLLP